MWDLNGSPDEETTRGGYDESEGCSSQKTTSLDKPGSNSSSSVVVVDDGDRSDADEGGGDRTNTTTSRKMIFGFSVLTSTNNGEDDNSTFSGDTPVTHQFFPVEMAGDGDGDPSSSSASFPRAPWAAVKFSQSPEVGAVGPGGNSKPVELAHPMKKSRRGPRSRSSQYRGVTYYRRTGRWESHIWSVNLFLSSPLSLCVSLSVDGIKNLIFFLHQGLREASLSWYVLIILFIKIQSTFFL